MDSKTDRVGWADGWDSAKRPEVEFEAPPEQLVGVARVLLLSRALQEGLLLRCPKCSWRVGPLAQWRCKQGCRHSWNVFATGGQCPACSAVQTETQCPKCRQSSPHLDWYAT